MQITADCITIRAPRRTSDRTIQQFLDTKAHWIQKKRAHQQKMALISTITYDDNGLPLAMHHLGKQIPIYLNKYDKKRVTIKEINSSITATLPSSRLDDILANAPKLKQVLTKRQRDQATNYLTQRTQVLNDELNLNVNKIIIKQYKRKYGQCKWNDISLDRKLIRFPIAISDHIIYHELAHLTKKHHQKSFRDLLKQYDPYTPQHKKRLKEHGPAMHSEW